MGSAQDSTKSEKKSTKKILNDLKNKLCGAFQKKKCEKSERVPELEEFKSNANDPPKPTSVLTFLAEHDRSVLEKALKAETIQSQIDAEERKNFTYTTVKEQNTTRSSKDSGFAEGRKKSDESVDSAGKESGDNQGLNEEELVETFKGLKCDEENDKKKKKCQLVYIARGKETQKGFKPSPSAPYQTFYNRQILSGGHVTVNPVENVFPDINQALSNVERTISFHAHSSQDDMLENLDLAHEWVVQELNPVSADRNADLTDIDHYINNQIFTESVVALGLLENIGVSEDNSKGSDYQQLDNILTPPRSNENFFNPDSPAQNNRPVYSVNSPMSQYTLSPSNEQYQDIPALPDLPESVLENEQIVNPTKERNKSNSSLNLKQFKDIQNQLLSEFGKEDCCKEDVGQAREAFKEMFMKLEERVREGLCLRLAELPLKTCYGVLHYILMDLSGECERENLLYAAFALICDRVYAESPRLFLEDFGLNLLKAAALRCSARPLLTRYLVQTIRMALDSPAGESLRQREAVFRETDQLGDTLVGALARRGDACAAALAEVVRRRSGQPPLFAVDHCNTEGMSALHTACAGHGHTRALRTVHVLLAHGGADVWRGDIKGGDMALHYAVKPGNCDCDLVMVLFKHVDRAKWKTLAHATNRGQVSPIETARAAAKSSRSNYPEEVLSFLRKCR